MADIFKKRLEKCSRLMKAEELDILLLAKPANMFYLTGDGRLCLVMPSSTVKRKQRHLKQILSSQSATAGFTLAASECEDTVLVTRKGCDILTGYPRQIEI